MERREAIQHAGGDAEHPEAETGREAERGGAVRVLELGRGHAHHGQAARPPTNAVDLSANGDLILVTNGIYAAGGRVTGGLTTNRLAITLAVTVQSVNGPAATVIQGYQVPGTTNGLRAVRCAYLANGAVLSGFTLQGGATRTDGTNGYGGGVLCQSTSATVTNCVLVGNAAVMGGGSFFGTVNNSIFSNNVAQSGGGAYAGTFNNSLFTGNSREPAERSRPQSSP